MRARRNTEPCDYTVGRWCVRVAEGLLADGDETHRLEPRVMAVLDHLVSHRDRPVSTEELVREVWGGVAVTDGAVVRAVAQLRRGLGDDARRPRYVRTLPRRGYVLIAEVREGGETDRLEEMGRPVASRARAALLAAAALLVALVCAAVWWGTGSAAEGLLVVEPFAELDETARQEDWSRALNAELAVRFAEAEQAVAFGEEEGARPARLLTGSVRREGQIARVTCRLTDGRTARQLCAGSCDLEVGSRLAAQRAAAEGIAGAVEAR